MTVTIEEAPAKFVPAAAVIRMGKRCSESLGLKRAQADLKVGSEIPGLNPGTAFETPSLEYRRGWENS